MTIIMTLLVRDEQDIIRENIEFHLSQGVDYFIATDNKSVDATTDILKEYEAKGLLHYIYEDNDNYNQHEWVTRMARIASTEYKADWVINNDADEFWLAKSGNLRDTFASISDTYNIIQAERNNFVTTDKTGPFYQHMIFKEKTSFNHRGKPLPPKVCHRGDKNIIVNQGNHSVSGINQQCKTHDLIEILHFPTRSYQQIENKIVKGGAAYESNEELPVNIGSTWRELYQEYKNNGNLFNYFKTQAYDEKRIRREIETGNLIKDTRLREQLEEIFAKEKYI